MVRASEPLVIKKLIVITWFKLVELAKIFLRWKLPISLEVTMLLKLPISFSFYKLSRKNTYTDGLYRLAQYN